MGGGGKIQNPYPVKFKISLETITSEYKGLVGFKIVQLIFFMPRETDANFGV